MQSYAFKYGGITYCVDYYVELLGIISILCEDQDAICDAGAIRCNQKYVAEAKEYFANAEYAPLTSLLELFSDEYNFNYDAPIQLMLMLSNGCHINKNALFYERKVIPDELFSKFLHMLLEFERTSRYNEFYKSHFEMFEIIIKNFISDYSRYNSHEYLLKTFKYNPDCEYCINFMLGITNANYGANIDNRIYCNIRPYHKTRYTNLPDYSYEPDYFATLVLHEFAHSFVNPAVAQYRSQIQTIEINKYRSDLSELTYGESIETLINETIIRAVECMYIKEKFPHYFNDYISEYENDGFVRIKEVIFILEDNFDTARVIELFKS